MDNKHAHTFWEKHYQHYDFFQMRLDWYLDTIKFHLNNVKDCKKVLDTGAGSGNLTIQLAQSVPSVTAIDSEPFALELMRQKALNLQLGFLIKEMDVHRLTFSGESFDGVTSMFLLPFIKDFEEYLSEVYRVLQVGGIFSISMWAPLQNLEDGWSLRQLVEKMLTEDGLLPKHQMEWDSLLETSRVNAQTIDSRNITEKVMLEVLQKIGFKDISFFPCIAYEKFAYFIKCTK